METIIQITIALVVGSIVQNREALISLLLKTDIHWMFINKTVKFSFTTRNYWTKMSSTKLKPHLFNKKTMHSDSFRKVCSLDTKWAKSQIIHLLRIWGWEDIHHFQIQGFHKMNIDQKNKIEIIMKPYNQKLVKS